jgi:hypothetical protein
LNGKRTYREHFRERFPVLYDAALTRAGRDSQILNNNIQNAYDVLVTDIVSSMQTRFGNHALSHHVRSQLHLLHQRSRAFNQSDIIIMPEDQYRVLQILGMYLGSSVGRKWPYFFLTGPAGTGKMHVTRMILNMLDQGEKDICYWHQLVLQPRTLVAERYIRSSVYEEAIVLISPWLMRTPIHYNY